MKNFKKNFKALCLILSFVMLFSVTPVLAVDNQLIVDEHIHADDCRHLTDDEFDAFILENPEFLEVPWDFIAENALEGIPDSIAENSRTEANDSSISSRCAHTLLVLQDLVLIDRTGQCVWRVIGIYACLECYSMFAVNLGTATVHHWRGSRCIDCGGYMV